MAKRIDISGMTPPAQTLGTALSESRVGPKKPALDGAESRFEGKKGRATKSEIAKASARAGARGSLIHPEQMANLLYAQQVWMGLDLGFEPDNGAAHALGRFVLRGTAPAVAGGEEQPRTIVAGVALAELAAGKNDEIWDADVVLMPRMKFRGKEIPGDIAEVLTGPEIQEPAIWGKQTYSSEDRATRSFEEGTVTARGRFLIRPTTEVDGQPRTIVAGVVLRDLSTPHGEEIWGGDVVLFPRRKIEPSGGSLGGDVDQVLISDAFANPEGIGKVTFPKKKL